MTVAGLFLGHIDAINAVIESFIEDNNVKLAWFNFKVSTVLSYIFNIIMALIIFLKRKDLAEAFSEDDVVIDLVVDVLPIIALTYLSIFSSVNACILALDLQNKAAFAAFSIHYLFSLPLAIFLGFGYELGIKGFWIGNCGGSFVVAIAYFIIILTADWQRIAD